MNQLKEQELRMHVPIAGWLLVANGVMGLVMSLFLFALMVSAGWFFTDLGTAVHDPEAIRIFSVMTGVNALFAGVISGLIAALSIPALIAGAGIVARKSWGRILGIVVSVFTLLNIPVGTLIGLYALFVLMQDSAAAYFASPPRGLKAAPQAA